MAKFIRFERCPKCEEKGLDRAGDNLAMYNDASGHCFSCGYHIHPRRLPISRIEDHGTEDKALLPGDYSRQIPTAAWKWLLQYQLSHSYWRPFVGYSQAHERLVFTYGTPVKFSIGRYLGEKSPGKPKWRLWGDGHGYVEVLGKEHKGPVVVVEDIISNHKVSQVVPSICLFGTNIHTAAIEALKASKRPVVLWLDGDQYPHLPKKIGRLQTLLSHPVRYIITDRDPKEHTLDEIRELTK
jgi:hypothetical protein